jgi:uncharacterized repeat protein (TIGR03803 family)
VTGGMSGTNCFAGCGIVFKLTPSKGQWTETVLYNFCSQSQCADGNAPTAGVVLDKNGNLYGTTQWGGGIPNNGVVYELAPSGTQQILHTFTCGSDGCNPHAGVVLKGANLYGTTEFGGVNGNNGTVFALKHLKSGQWQEQVIYAFCAQFLCSDGSSPLAELTIDRSGNLYGTTFSGGATQWAGVVFKLSRPKSGHSSETFVYSFTAGADGFNPHVGLVSDATGSLYGVTFQGGSGGYGTAVKITP